MGRFDFRTRNGQISAIIQGQAGTSIDSDAQAFYDRVTAAGGTLTQTEKDAISTLVLSFKSAGVWTLMKAIYPMVGASAAACAQNLKSSSFTGTFTSGWLFTSSAAIQNGSSSFMNTGLNTSIELLKTSAHLSVYVRTNSSGGYDFANSSDSGATVNATYLITRYGNDNSYFGIADQSYGTSISMSDSKGFTLGATNGSTTQKIYKNGSLIKTGSAGSGSLANNNIYLGANNGNGTANLFCDKQYCFASIGNGLTDTQASDIYTAVQAFQTSLSRQV